MQLIYSCLLFGFMMVVSTYGQSCSCFCGSTTYTPGFNCSSAASCAIMCNSNYAACTGSNTYGCCGTSCMYYSSAVRCSCQCASSISGAVHFVGYANVDTCTTSSCKVACSSTYTLTCRPYSNKSYCSHAIREHQPAAMFILVFSFITLYLSSKYFFI